MRLMHCIEEADLAAYLKADRIASLLRKWERPGADAFASHRWLRTTPPKRMIFDEMYGDLMFENRGRLRVLDVGGGITALTRLLARRHDYYLLDYFAHENPALVRAARELRHCPDAVVQQIERRARIPAKALHRASKVQEQRRSLRRI